MEAGWLFWPIFLVVGLVAVLLLMWGDDGE